MRIFDPKLTGSIEFLNPIRGGITGSIFGSSSYALTASYAMNGGGGGGTPGGTNTQLQYNNSNTFDGVPVATYDGTTLRLTGSFSGSLTGQLFGTASFSNNVAGGYVTSFNTRQGSVTLASTDISGLGAGIVSSSAQLTSTFLEIVGDNVISSSTQLTNTFLEITGDNVISSSVLSAGGSQGQVTNTVNGVATTITATQLGTTGNPQFNNITASIVSSSNGFTGSLFGTASFARTASFSLNGGVTSFNTRQGAVNLQSSDISGLAAGILSSSAQLTSTFLEIVGDNVVSSSTFSSPSQGTLRATINGIQTDVDLGLQTADSVQFVNITGSIISASAGFTGSLFGTASFARTASFVTGSIFTNNNVAASSSFSTTSSFSLTSSLSRTASYVEYSNVGNKPTLFSGSSQVQLNQINGTTFADTLYTFPNNVTIEGNLTAEQLIVSSSVYFVTTSFSSGSTIFGNSLDDLHQFTGSVRITGSLGITGSVNSLGGFTGSLFGTSSWGLTSSFGVNFNVSGSITNADSLQFNTTPPSIPITPGKMLWDSGEGTLQLGLAGGNVDLNLGEQLYQYVYNAEATTLTLGTVVYVSSSQGGRIAVKRASATAEQGSANTLGFVAEAIGAGAEGWVMTEGSLRGVDTTGYTPGGLIFLSESAGQYTNQFPQAPLHSVRLGYAQKIDASGIIYVKIDNGYELDELHDIKATNSTSGDLLVRSGSLWINSKQLTGSYGLTGSLTVINGGITSSLFGTATTASYVRNLYISSSETANPNPSTNELWHDASTGKTYIRYRSGSNESWILQSDPTIDVTTSLQTLQEVTDLGSTTDNIVTITNITNATDSGSGALIVSGGAGFRGDVWAKKYYGDGSGLTGVIASYTETDTLQSVTTRGNETSASVFITNTTNATAVGLGALRVSGGLSVGLDIVARNISASFTGSLLGTASYVTGSIFNSTNPALSSSFSNTSSFSITSSYALNSIPAFPFTGSARISGSLLVTGSISSTQGGFTGSLLGTASYVTGAIHNSANPALSSSYAVTSSFALFALSTPASGLGGSGTTNRVAKFSAPTTLADSNIFDNSSEIQITGSNVIISGSNTNFRITGSVLSAGGFTGSLQGTASFATTASYALNGGVTQILAGTNISINPTNGLGNVTINATTEATSDFPYTGSAIISGSLKVTGSFQTLASGTEGGAIAGNVNNYLEFYVQNFSNGISASSDLVAYNDTGNKSQNYVDMGINSSGISSTYSFGKANDAYVYNTGGDLFIGNSTAFYQPTRTSQSLHLFANAPGRPDITITGSRVGIQKSSSLNAALDVLGNVMISGALHLTGSADAELKVLGESEFTGSVKVTNGVVAQSFTGSLFGTASYVTGSIHNSANPALSASYALTASFALNAGSSTGGGGNTFVTYSVAGQNDVTASASTDTLTLVAGSGMVLTTNQATQAITFASTNANNFTRGITIADPTNAEDVTIMFTTSSLTINRITSVIRGTAAPSITYTLRYAATRSLTGTEVITGGTVVASPFTGSALISSSGFNNASVPGNNFIWLETTAKSGTVNELFVQFQYQ